MIGQRRLPQFTAGMSEVDVVLTVEPHTHVRIDLTKSHPGSTLDETTLFLTATDIIMLRGLLASGLDVLKHSQEKPR